MRAPGFPLPVAAGSLDWAMDDATTTAPTDAPDEARSPFAPDESAEAGGDASPVVTSERPGPLTVSDAALEQVMTILSAEDEPEGLALRVEITGSRGSEYTYDLSFEERSAADPEDLIYHQGENGELTVMVPAESVDPLWGATLDLPAASGQGGLVIRNPNRPDPLGAKEVDLSGTVSERVEQLLEQSINPALASHGGFAKLVELIEDETKAIVTMGGGCQGCAVSAMTLRDGISKSILEHVPEIVEVLDATDHDAGENPYYAP